MKKYLLSIGIMLCIILPSQAQIPDGQELIGVNRLTTAQINQIANPVEGSLIYNLDLSELQVYTGSAWLVPGFTSSQEEIIEVYDSNASYTISRNTFTQIQLNTTRINQGGNFTLNNNEVTVSEAGTYEVEYGVSALTAVWSAIDTKLQLNGSDVIASEAYNGGFSRNSSCTRRLFLQLQTNDTLSLFATRSETINNSANSAQTIQNGSYLLIRRVN